MYCMQTKGFEARHCECELFRGILMAQRQQMMVETNKFGKHNVTAAE